VTSTFTFQTHSVGKTQNFLMIPHLVHIFTTGPQKFMRFDICHLSIAAVDIIYMHLTVLVCYLFWPFSCPDVMNWKLFLHSACVCVCVCVREKDFCYMACNCRRQRVLYARTYLHLMVGRWDHPSRLSICYSLFLLAKICNCTSLPADCY